MIKKTITYTDYNGNERTEDFYFNLSKAEIVEMELSASGGLTAMLEGIVNAEDAVKAAGFIKELILRSYGEKSADGRRFVKSEELSTEFSQTEAFSELFIEITSDIEQATLFVKGILPGDIQQAVAEADKKEEAPKPAKRTKRAPKQAASPNLQML